MNNVVLFLILGFAFQLGCVSACNETSKLAETERDFRQVKEAKQEIFDQVDLIRVHLAELNEQFQASNESEVECPKQFLEKFVDAFTDSRTKIPVAFDSMFSVETNYILKLKVSMASEEDGTMGNTLVEAVHKLQKIQNSFHDAMNDAILSDFKMLEKLQVVNGSNVQEDSKPLVGNIMEQQLHRTIHIKLEQEAMSINSDLTEKLKNNPKPEAKTLLQLIQIVQDSMNTTIQQTVENMSICASNLNLIQGPQGSNTTGIGVGLGLGAGLSLGSLLDLGDALGLAVGSGSSGGSGPGILGLGK